jgi:DNA polymerase III delta subunit
MLYVLWGQRFWSKKKLTELLIRATEKDNAVFRLRPENTQPIGAYLSGDLFGKKVCVIGEMLFENSDYETEIKNLLGSLVSTESLIFLREGELSKEWQRRFEKACAKIEEFKKPGEAKLSSWAEAEAEARGVKISHSQIKQLVSESGEDPPAIINKLERMCLEELKFETKNISRPNYFNFADAVSDKNKHQSLRLLSSYIKEGLGAEEAYWKLWWKIKTLRIADSNAKGHELHPFVMQKAHEDLRNFSSDELNKLSFALMDVFSEVRRGEENFEEGLEKILLKL